MIRLDLAEAKRLVREAVAERGEDYVYVKPPLKPCGAENFGSCYYVHATDMWPEGDDERPVEATPGCLVGVVLHRAGVQLSTLQDHDDDGFGATDAQGLVNGLAGTVLDTTPQVANYLREVQICQDRGQPWGVAMRTANMRYSDEPAEITAENPPQSA